MEVLLGELVDLTQDGSLGVPGLGAANSGLLLAEGGESTSLPHREGGQCGDWTAGGRDEGPWGLVTPHPVG